MDDRTVAIILAGGQGTRVRELYPGLPKLLIPAAGQPFVEWILRHLAAQGIERFVISLGHLAPVAESYFKRRRSDSLSICTVREEEPLGTGGAVAFAHQAAAGDAERIVVVNGDSLVLADFSPAWQALEDQDVDGALLGVEVDDASRYGRLEVDYRGRLVRFVEKQGGCGLVNAGVYFFRRRTMDDFPTRHPLSIERDVFPHLLSAGRQLAVASSRASFIDIGTPETAHEATRFIDRHFHRTVLA